MKLEKKKEILERILTEHGVMSEALHAGLLSFVDDKFTRSNEFSCPQCSAKLEVHTEIRVKRVVNSTGQRFTATGAQIATRPMKAAHPLTDSPLVPALIDAFDKLPAACRPKDLVDYLGSLIERGVPIRLAPSVKRTMYEHFNTIKIQAFSTGGMAVIIADGEFRQFIPVSVLKGLALTGITANGSEITRTRSEYTPEIWIKTRFGYIAQRGVFFDEMRKRSVGAFAA